MNLASHPALDRLAGHRSVLIAGAGGGFDIFCGLPIALWLHGRGVRVTLANLTFTRLDLVDEPWVMPGMKRVEASSQSKGAYFPEGYLSRWLETQGIELGLYCFDKSGVVPLAASYRHIVEAHDVDAVLLVDGGTDSLLRGDESRLGTPHEDMTSLAAVATLELETRLLAFLGFGVDAYHGVCHAHVLEAAAALTEDGGYLGMLGLHAGMREVAAYMDAVDVVNATPGQRPSIVNASIVAALRGQFGAFDPTGRSAGETFWINPLMTQMWFFDLQAVVRRSLLIPHLKGTEAIEEVGQRVLKFRLTHTRRRKARPIPH